MDLKEEGEHRVSQCHLVAFTYGESECREQNFAMRQEHSVARLATRSAPALVSGDRMGKEKTTMTKPRLRSLYGLPKRGACYSHTEAQIRGHALYIAWKMSNSGITRTFPESRYSSFAAQFDDATAAI
jgi:hypothetical protein